MEKCVVCNVKFENIILNSNFGNVEKLTEKLSYIHRKILWIFCNYFKLPCEQYENPEGSEILSSFPFCAECRNLVVELCIFHEKLESIHKIIQKTVAKISIKILNTVENECENCSDSTSQNEEEKENRKINGKGISYRQKIVQNFSPRVILTKFQLPEPVSKQNIESTTIEPNGDFYENLTDNNHHDNENNSKENDKNEGVQVDKSRETEKKKSLSATEKRVQNLMEKIRCGSWRQNSHVPSKVVKIPSKVQKKSSSRSAFAQSRSRSRGFKKQGNKFVHSSGSWFFEKSKFGWKCGSCQKIYKSTSATQMHMETWHISGDFNCKSCSRSFCRLNLLRAHRCHKKMSKPIFQIHPTKFSYDGKWKFTTTAEDKFQCSTCFVILSTKVIMRAHIKNVHDSRQLQCKICERFLNTEEQLKRHEASHPTPESESKSMSMSNSTSAEQIKCSDAEKDDTPICSTETKFVQPCTIYYKKVKGTQKYVHKSGNWFYERTKLGWKCGSCPKIFTVVRSIRKHLELWHISGDFKCQFCPRSFSRENLLRVHRCGVDVEMNKTSVEVSPGKFIYNGKWEFTKLADGSFQCSICSATRKKKDRMPGHMKSKHDTPDLQCEICGRFFQTKPEIKIHVATHSIPTPSERLKCPETDCDFTFKSKSSLRLHQKKKHNAQRLKPILEKKFQCENPGCPKKFVSLIFLKRHLALHEKCFICPKSECRERFSNFEDMEIHFKKHKLLNQSDSEDDEQGENEEEKSDSKSRGNSTGKKHQLSTKRKKRGEESETESEEEVEFSDEEDEDAELTTEESESEQEQEIDD